MNQDKLTSEVLRALTSSAKLSARDLARKLGVTRKEVNSRLYSHLDVLFAKEGSDPPLWSLASPTEAGPPGEVNRRSPSMIMKSSGLEDKRHVSDDDLSTLARKLIGSDEIQFRANGINVEVSLAAMSLSDPYFAFEVMDSTTMQVVINTTAVPEVLLGDREYLFGHLVHCVADSFVFRAIEQSGSSMNRDDLYQFKNRVLLQLGFDPARNLFT